MQGDMARVGVSVVGAHQVGHAIPDNQTKRADLVFAYFQIVILAIANSGLLVLEQGFVQGCLHLRLDHRFSLHWSSWHDPDFVRPFPQAVTEFIKNFFCLPEMRLQVVKRCVRQ